MGTGRRLTATLGFFGTDGMLQHSEFPLESIDSAASEKVTLHKFTIPAKSGGPLAPIDMGVLGFRPRVIAWKADEGIGITLTLDTLPTTYVLLPGGYSMASVVRTVVASDVVRIQVYRLSVASACDVELFFGG
jgi:hypothetical protein